MAGHSSSQSPLFSTSSTLQKIPFELASSSRSRTPASFEIDSTVFLKTPSKVHLPSLPSRRVGRDSTWIEMMDMEEGRARESRTSEVEGDWRNLSAPRTNFEAPGHDSYYAQSSLTEPSPPSPTLVSKMALAWQYFIGILCTLYTIGICHLYFEKFRMRPERSSMSARRSSVAGVDPTHAQWLTVVRRMCGIWRLARVGCGLLLPLSVALLQIDGVVTTVFAKTCVISTAIFAGAGILSSAMYLFCRRQLSSGKNREKWKEASAEPTGLKTAVFWTCLALPVTTLLWAVLSCVVSIVCIAWTRHSDIVQEQRTSFVASAVFLTFLTVISVFYVGKAAQFVLWLVPEER
ncbi:hypothetical protein CPC08DRAFT_822877 [Agrocybe pediades]|nr:hypothetical protein CPC08DRAFT_822877 [Agrocybe pediades]